MKEDSETNERQSVEGLDLDKQLWLAKQKEISENEIIQRKKKRYWYRMKGRIILVVSIIVMIVMNRCNAYVENENNLNGKITKENKNIEDYYRELGKKIYESKIKFSNVEIKDYLTRINQSKEIINELNDKVQDITLKLKNSDMFDDLPDVSKVLSTVEKFASENDKKNKKIFSKKTKPSKKLAKPKK